MTYETPLPGHEPAFVRLQFTMDDNGLYDLDVAAASAPGFVTRAESDHYDLLTGEEATDVAMAVLEALLRR